MIERRDRPSSGKAAIRPRTGAATAAADAESGTEPEDVRRDLHALKVLLDRGLIAPEDYDARRKELIGDGSPGGTGDTV